MESRYDSFQESRAVVERLFRIGKGEVSVLPGSEDWAEMRREAEPLFADDVQLVTRDGVLYGPERVFDDLAVQATLSVSPACSSGIRSNLGARSLSGSAHAA